MPVKTLTLQTKVGLVAAMGIAGIGLGACNTTKATSTPAGAPSAAVKVAKAQQRNVPLEWKGIGNVEAFTTVTIKAQVGGQMINVLFKEGDFVKKGQTLFEIQPKPFLMAVQQWEANLARDIAAVRQAEANLARDVAQEKYARSQAERYAQLTKEGIFSKEQADQMSTDANAKAEAVKADLAAIESAKAAIKADEASLEVARVQLGYCTIKSPMDGRTGDIKVQLGNLVKATDVELVTIHQVQPVYVTFSVPENQLGNVKKYLATGQLRIQASAPNQPETLVNGKLAFIDNGVDMTTGSIKLKGEFNNSPLKLWPGQFVDVTMHLADRPNMVTIPGSAVQTGQMGSYVYVMKSDSTAELRPIVTASRIQTDMAVESGLTAGETVVTEGQIRIAPGARLKVIQ